MHYLTLSGRRFSCRGSMLSMNTRGLPGWHSANAKVAFFFYFNISKEAKKIERNCEEDKS